jgi:Cytochrome oxidase complex assembly protein 1
MLIAAACAVLIAAGAISLTIVESVSKGPAFQAAMSYLKTSSYAGVTRQQLGVILGTGLGVTGPVAETGDSGNARISFDVHGNWRTGHVTLDLVKIGHSWVVTDGVLSVDGQQYRMPCKQKPSSTSCLMS